MNITQLLDNFWCIDVSIQNRKDKQLLILNQLIGNSLINIQKQRVWKVL